MRNQIAIYLILSLLTGCSTMGRMMQGAGSGMQQAGNDYQGNQTQNCQVQQTGTNTYRSVCR